VAVGAIACRILIVRGLRVLVDSDLSALYGVPTKRFNQSVKGNPATRGAWELKERSRPSSGNSKTLWQG
jgi:hypothetical protein